MDEIEAGGIPVLMLRGQGGFNPDGIRDYDLSVPMSAAELVEERHAAARGAWEAEAETWRKGLTRRLGAAAVPRDGPGA